MTTEPTSNRYAGDELLFEQTDPTGARLRVFDRSDFSDRVLSIRYAGAELGWLPSGCGETGRRALALLICPELGPVASFDDLDDETKARLEAKAADFLAEYDDLAFRDASSTARIVNRPPILRFFEYAHLPEHLQAVSRPFCDLAEAVAVAEHRAECSEETLVALRKLLEAKDAAVRAALR